MGYTGKKKSVEDPSVTIPKNGPANAGGINITAGAMSTADVVCQGSSGNPGEQLPWEGADATSIGANSALPPLTHLGDAGGGHG